MRTSALFWFVGLLVIGSVVEASTKCGKHQHLVSCFPCQPLCNGKVFPCPALCSKPASFCACKIGYCRIRSNSHNCVKKPR